MPDDAGKPVENYQRVALIGGVYSNYLALQVAVDDALRRGAQAIFCLGDLGAFGPDPDRVFPILQAHGVRVVQGNYDNSIGNNLEDCQCGYTDPRDNYFAKISYDYTFANTSEENRRWMRDLPAEIRFRMGDYWVLLCEISGLPRDIGFIRANFAARNQGHLMIWCCRCPQTPLYQLYVLGDFQTSAEVIEATCAADLQRLGARLEKVVEARRWPYFPHVTTAAMAGGFYKRLEALQGRRRTFYCGEIMSFSTLECCARYARDLVERFFVKRAGQSALEIASKTETY